MRRGSVGGRSVRSDVVLGARGDYGVLDEHERDIARGYGHRPHDAFIRRGEAEDGRERGAVRLDEQLPSALGRALGTALPTLSVADGGDGPGGS